MNIKLFFFIAIVFVSTAFGQTRSDSGTMRENNVDTDPGHAGRFEFSSDNANPKARKLMNEAFFWDPVEETAPFGSDDGFDAAYEFREWRNTNKNADPVTFLKELMSRWNYPYFAWNEMDSHRIKIYLDTDVMLDDSTIRVMKEALKDVPVPAGQKRDDVNIEESIRSSAKGLPIAFLTGQDNAIIGVGFAQLVLEGHIDKDLKQLTVTAIKRELLPILIDRYDKKYQRTRKDQLTKMLHCIKLST